jgi:DNA-binding NarL/FixJ family response regulator
VTDILIADHHDAFRSALRVLLDAQSNWEVVAEAADGKEAILRTIEIKPDVVVLDYALPLVDGLEVTRHIRARLRKTEVLIFTVQDDRGLIEALLQAGARGYLNKSDAEHDLIEAIEALAVHKPFFTSRVSEALLEEFLARPNRPGSTLTNRERSVMQLIVEGYSSRQTAEILNIGIKTVETHRAAIMRKLNLSSSTALVRYAVRNQFVVA